MPDKIVDINEIVGGDIVFRYGNPVVEYRLPGDIDVDNVFMFLDAFATLSSIQNDDPDKAADTVKERFTLIKEQLLELFRIRMPELDRWPFGMRGTGVVLKHVLSELGMNVTAEDPTPPSPNRKARRATATKPRVK